MDKMIKRGDLLAQRIRIIKKIPKNLWFNVQCIDNSQKEVVLTRGKIYRATLNPTQIFKLYYIRCNDKKDPSEYFITRFKRV